ncbi:MAG: hypothetical protein GQ535_06050 [Rhodobacteraceae bacterium]|nr:hypothetical protein [Paracoccaceae bacterium]
MLTFLINLDHRTDRMAFMQAQLGPMGLGFNRISAVNGLGEDDIGYPADHPRLTKGEFACYLSHINCWRAFLATDAERCLIMEDDVAFGPDFMACLEHSAFFDHDGCITRLECRPYPTVLRKRSRHMFNGTRLRQQMAYDGGTAAYVIGRDYAAYLLKHHSTPKIPVDDQILNPYEIDLRPHKIFQLDPAPATQRIFLNKASPSFNPESDLEAGRQYPTKNTKPRGIVNLITSFLTTRAKNARRNLFYVSKTVPFSGENR